MATPRPHDADAGGDPAVLQAKADLREQAWAALQDAGAARFPGARHRIPNFTGAEDAAERLRATDAWARAAVVKCNPDSPQWPVVATGRIPLRPHDVRLHLVVTPTRTLAVEVDGPVAPAIDWGELTDDKVASIPLLARLHGDLDPTRRQ